MEEGGSGSPWLMAPIHVEWLSIWVCSPSFSWIHCIMRSYHDCNGCRSPVVPAMSDTRLNGTRTVDVYITKLIHNSLLASNLHSCPCVHWLSIVAVKNAGLKATDWAAVIQYTLGRDAFILCRFRRRRAAKARHYRNKKYESKEYWFIYGKGRMKEGSREIQLRRQGVENKWRCPADRRKNGFNDKLMHFRDLEENV